MVQQAKLGNPDKHLQICRERESSTRSHYPNAQHVRPLDRVATGTSVNYRQRKSIELGRQFGLFEQSYATFFKENLMLLKVGIL
jgi:hypothetical protein